MSTSLPASPRRTSPRRPAHPLEDLSQLVPRPGAAHHRGPAGRAGARSGAARAAPAGPGPARLVPGTGLPARGRRAHGLGHLPARDPGGPGRPGCSPSADWACGPRRWPPGPWRRPATARASWRPRWPPKPSSRRPSPGAWRAWPATWPGRARACNWPGAGNATDGPLPRDGGRARAPARLAPAALRAATAVGWASARVASSGAPSSRGRWDRWASRSGRAARRCSPSWSRA
jgi:hypothetical protein